MKCQAIPELITELKKGRPIVMVDDEHRENEGDIIFPAECINDQMVNFMASHAKGLICLSLTEERCKQLNLPLMVPAGNGTKYGTNFTLSIEAAEGVTTGISAQDRAKTIQAAVAKKASAQDIVQPGHIFPIIAKPGGVLERAGHTEASVDLMRLAGFEPAGVICEIMNEDGTMAKGQDLMDFCQKHQLKIGSIEELIAFRVQHEPTVECIHEFELPIKESTLKAYIFLDHISQQHHYAFVKGKPCKEQEAYVRVHMHDPLLDLSFMQGLSTGHWRLEDSLKAIINYGNGALVLLSQTVSPQSNIENIGLFSYLQGNQSKPVSQSRSASDLKQIGVGSQVLSALGYGKIRVLGSEKGYYGLPGFGLEVVGFKPHLS